MIVDLIKKEARLAMVAHVKGDAYEGLLEKNAQDTKSGTIACLSVNQWTAGKQERLTNYS